MKVDVYNMEGEKVKKVELPESIFGAPIHIDLMHQAYTRQMANARLGTHSTKTRSEVSGGGRKPWRQKGTGRARQGSIRSVQWKGGGKIHTPHPHKYTQSMPKKMRRMALRSALSAKAADAGILVLDELKLAEPKTRLMAKALDTLIGDASALILIPEKAPYEMVIRSTNNLPGTKIMLANNLNVRDVMMFDRVIIPVAALEVLKENFG